MDLRGNTDRVKRKEEGERGYGEDQGKLAVRMLEWGEVGVAWVAIRFADALG